MNTETIKILCDLNTDFYNSQCSSFSATRQAPWTGWQTCLKAIHNDVISPRGKSHHCPGCKNLSSNDAIRPGGVLTYYPGGENVGKVSVFDLACGNLRFEEFLGTELPDTEFAFYAVDNCDGLVPQENTVHYQSLDVLEVLQRGQRINDQLAAPLCDLSVSFGFMHHVPSQAYRKKVLQSLVDQTRQGGYIAVSFWQFMRNEALAEKAHLTHKQALCELDLVGLEENDYLLGWKDVPGAYRYCHSFTNSEIDELVEAVSEKITLVARFTADGRSDNLNSYVVLKAQQ